MKRQKHFYEMLIRKWYLLNDDERFIATSVSVSVFLKTILRFEFTFFKQAAHYEKLINGCVYINFR